MVVVDGIDLDEYYVVKTPYNGTGDDGGDPMVDNMNIWYEVRDNYYHWFTCDGSRLLTPAV